jgi:hypothetical protein
MTDVNTFSEAFNGSLSEMEDAETVHQGEWIDAAGATQYRRTIASWRGSSFALTELRTGSDGGGWVAGATILQEVMQWAAPGGDAEWHAFGPQVTVGA